MDQEDSPGAAQEEYRRWEVRNREFDRLLLAARAGSIAAFEELYDATARWLLSVVRRVVGDGQAEDVLADVYLQVWRDLARYDPARGRPSVWLAVMARTRALDHLRREKRLAGDARGTEVDVPCDPRDGPEETLTRWQRTRMVRLSLAALDRQERLVIALAYFQECTHSEIARRTGLPLGAVRASMSRARQKLRTSLAAVGGSLDRQHAL